MNKIINFACIETSQTTARGARTFVRAEIIPMRPDPDNAGVGIHSIRIFIQIENEYGIKSHYRLPHPFQPLTQNHGRLHEPDAYRTTH